MFNFKDFKCVDCFITHSEDSYKVSVYGYDNAENCCELGTDIFKTIQECQDYYYSIVVKYLKL